MNVNKEVFCQFCHQSLLQEEKSEQIYLIEKCQHFVHAKCFEKNFFEKTKKKQLSTRKTYKNTCPETECKGSFSHKLKKTKNNSYCVINLKGATEGSSEFLRKMRTVSENETETKEKSNLLTAAMISTCVLVTATTGLLFPSIGAVLAGFAISLALFYLSKKIIEHIMASHKPQTPQNA